jgi:hypothetical protein
MMHLPQVIEMKESSLISSATEWVFLSAGITRCYGLLLSILEVEYFEEVGMSLSAIKLYALILHNFFSCDFEDMS